MKVFAGIEVVDGQLQKEIERSIDVVVEIAQGEFKAVLEEGRSLRKDDVRSRRTQERLLALTVENLRR